MKILISQPNQEQEVIQLKNEIIINPKVDIFLYPEGYLVDEESLNSACILAKIYNKTIITGYKSNGINRAVIINHLGEKVLDRAKTPVNEELYMPSVIDVCELKIGYLLCREIFMGIDGLNRMADSINFIAHPIGVGMFSEEQFDEWVTLASDIAKACNTIVIGASHADGKFNNSEVSIPISYCIDKTGEPIFISKSDTRTRIFDLVTKNVEVL